MRSIVNTITFILFSTICAACGPDIRFIDIAEDSCGGKEAIVEFFSVNHPAAPTIRAGEESLPFRLRIASCIELDDLALDITVNDASTEERPQFEDFTDSDGLIIAEGRPALAALWIEAETNGGDFSELAWTKIDPARLTESSATMLVPLDIDMSEATQINLAMGLLFAEDIRRGQVFTISAELMARFDKIIRPVMTNTLTSVKVSIGL